MAVHLPTGMLIVICYIYVFVIAHRHARDIRNVRRVVRNKELGDHRHCMRASMQLVVQPQNAAPEHHSQQQEGAVEEAIR